MFFLLQSINNTGQSQTLTPQAHPKGIVLGSRQNAIQNLTIMKTLKYFIVCALMSTTYSFAQVSVNVNVGTPAWGVPVTTERYYYIPDIETYYDIPSREYIYMHNGVWVRSVSVPVIYRNYDFHRGRKIVIHDYNGRAPYAYYNVHRVKYMPAHGSHTIYVKDKHHAKHAKSRGHKNGHRRHRHYTSRLVRRLFVVTIFGFALQSNVSRLG